MHLNGKMSTMLLERWLTPEASARQDHGKPPKRNVLLEVACLGLAVH